MDGIDWKWLLRRHEQVVVSLAINNQREEVVSVYLADDDGNIVRDKNLMPTLLAEGPDMEHLQAIDLPEDEE